MVEKKRVNQDSEGNTGQALPTPSPETVNSPVSEPSAEANPAKGSPTSTTEPAETPGSVPDAQTNRTAGSSTPEGQAAFPPAPEGKAGQVSPTPGSEAEKGLVSQHTFDGNDAPIKTKPTRSTLADIVTEVCHLDP